MIQLSFTYNFRKSFRAVKNPQKHDCREKAAFGIKLLTSARASYFACNLIRLISSGMKIVLKKNGEPSMSNITQAVQALRDQIMDVGYTEGVVEEIAKEWEIKPELLQRKFTEVVGHEPQSWNGAALIGSKIQQARAEAGIMRRNFAPGAMRMRLEEGGGEVEIYGLALRVPPRRLIVAIAVNDRDLIGIEAGSATSGNPLVRVSIEKELGGREALAEAFRDALAREPKTGAG